MADEQPVEQTIVTAVGTAVGTNPSQKARELGKRVEQAMADEVRKCAEEGISTEEKNSILIRERMQAARKRVLNGEQ